MNLKKSLHNQNHKPVLIEEVLKYLKPEAGKVYVDGTFGRGGYTKEILKSGATVYGVDRDEDACLIGYELEKQYPGKFTMIKGCFADIKDHLIYQGQGKIDGLVLDLGVSSPQIDTAERGFSFQKDGPLDMRMGQEGDTAAYLINNLSEEELANIIYEYGEERKSRHIASRIIEKRAVKPIETTMELADIVRSVVPKERKGFDPSTRTFQAFRIKVNDELGQLEKILKDSEEVLKTEGCFVVVSFHSLEDRIVKRFFKEKSDSNFGVNRHMPRPISIDKKPIFKLLTKKGVKASEIEIYENPRSRSAVLRAVMKLSEIENNNV